MLNGRVHGIVNLHVVGVEIKGLGQAKIVWSKWKTKIAKGIAEKQENIQECDFACKVQRSWINKYGVFKQENSPEHINSIGCQKQGSLGV